ncbi:MAG: M56 family metallopeptidase [Lachnospiraceae bacterium]|nr:M56 family metallopeptidase [Lachnospiraceae bacterium]
MSGIFITVLNMSLTASYCILVVIALRLLLRRQPKLLSYILWSVVLFRLLCPVSISGSYSLMRMDTNIISMENIAVSNDVYENTNEENYDAYDNGAAMPDTAEAGNAENMSKADRTEAARLPRLNTIVNVVSWIWLIGVMLLILRSSASAMKLRRFLSKAVRTEDNIYEDEGIDTPFVMGIISPKIYLPPHLPEHERAYVLAHESIHIARKDYMIKLAAYLTACIHWFNPLVWLAFSLMENDMEMSCDEAVLKKMGMENKEKYSRTLLSLSSETPMLQGNPIAFGERKVKERVSNILSYRKKAVLTVVLTVAVLVAVGLGLAINPEAKSDIDESGNISLGSEPDTDAPENINLDANPNMSSSEKLNKFVQEYAEAFCDRNGEKIASLYVDESTALADGEDMLLEKTEGGYSFGWSSPWPFFNDYRYLINEGEKKANIWYYAIVSDPHVTVWKQEIRYTETDGKYYLTETSMQFMDSISSKSEFDEAYLIEGEHIFVDYIENGFSESILSHMEEENSPFDYTVYEKPEIAAEYILNLTGGVSVDESSSYSDSDKAGLATVRYTFADGSEVDIPMCAFTGDEAAGGRKVWIVDTHVWNAGAP